MFRFEDPKYLWLLALVVVLAAIHFFSRLQQRRRLRRFGDPGLVKELMPDVSRWRPAVKFWLLEAALALLIVCLARPQFGKRVSETVRGGIEAVIAIDVSNSMLAEDVKPSRLRRAKMMVESLVDHFTNDKIGLIVFAGDAFVQMPITSDSVSVKMFLNNIDPSMIRNQGTDIGEALSLAANCFTDEQDVGKAIIVITDGEDHEEGALEAARQAHEMGRNIYVLGIGSTSGAPIRLPGTNDFMQDNRGEKVMTALNEDMCRQVAEAGDGIYIHVDNSSSAQRQLEEALSGLQQKENTVYSDYDEQFQAFGVLALLLLIVEACLLERKNRILKNFKLFRRPVGMADSKALAFVLPLLLCLLPFSHAGAQSLDHQGARLQVKQGNKAFRSDRRNEATTLYQKAVKADSTNARALYNLATSMIPVEWQNVTHAQEWSRMEPGKRDTMVTDIVKLFHNAAGREENTNRRQLSFYNAGVLCQGAATGNEQQQQQYLQKAIEQYKEALKYNPNDDEARYNLVLCMRQLKPGQGDGGGQGDNKDENDDKQKEEQQQEQQQQQDQKQEQQQQQPPKQQMSEDNVEQLLKAAMQNEEQTQRRVEQNQRPPEQRRQLNEKNW